MVWMQTLRNAMAQLVVAFERDGRSYLRETVTVRDAVPKVRAWFPVSFAASVPPDARQGDRIAVDLENPRAPVYVGDLEMRWITAENGDGR